MWLNKVINKRTNKEQMLIIFKIRLLLENRRRLYSAEIPEQNIFQSILFIYSNIHLTDLRFRQAEGKKNNLKNPTNTKMQEKIR